MSDSTEAEAFAEFKNHPALRDHPLVQLQLGILTQAEKMLAGFRQEIEDDRAERKQPDEAENADAKKDEDERERKHYLRVFAAQALANPSLTAGVRTAEEVSKKCQKYANALWELMK